MKASKFFLFALVSTLLGACNKEEQGTVVTDRTPLTINAGITTRATDTEWTTGDAIGVMMYAGGTNDFVDGKANFRYITALPEGTFAPDGEANTAYFPKEAAPADITAYYPYTAGVTTALSLSTANQADLSKIDFLLADKVTGLTEKNPTAALKFRHQLAKLVISVTPDATVAGIDLAGATLLIKGTASTASYSFTDNALTTGAAADINLPYTLKNGAIITNAIVMPTVAGTGVALELTTAVGKKFTAALATTTKLEAGTVNTLRMAFGQTASTITATVADWVSGVTENLDEAISLEGITTGTGLSGTGAVGDKLELTCATGITGAKSATYTAAIGAGDVIVWNCATPLFWNDFAAKNGNAVAQHTFNAFFTPAASSNPEKDYLRGSSTVDFGDAIDFSTDSNKLAHMMSRMKLVLENVTDAGVVESPFTKTQFDAITATFTLKKSSAVAFSGITLGSTAAAEGLSPARTYNIAGETATNGTFHTFAPQALADANVITLTYPTGSTENPGETRTVSIKPGDISVGASKLTALEASKQYTLTLKVVKSDKVKVTVSVSVTDWTAIDGSGNVEL